MKRFFVFIVIITIIFSTLTVGHRDKKSDMELTIYASLMEEQAIAAVDKFERETGIKTNFIRMSSGEILKKIREEKDSMKASVWYGGTADTFIAAYEEGLIEPYISPNASIIPPKYKDGDGTWTGIYVGYLGFVANDRWLKNNNLNMPNSWDDLLKPEFEGNIVLPNPATSGTAYTMVSTIVQLMGEEKGFEYLKKLDKQVIKYTKSGLTPGIVVGINEAGVGVTFLNNVVRYKKDGYRNIIMSTPMEGTGYEIGAVALLKNAPNKDAAKMFIDWALTEKAQEIGQQVGSYQLLTNPKATPPKEPEYLTKVNLIDYDFQYAGKNRNYLIDKFIKNTK
ncbi:ABC transporter substrate-binding protein [Anaeromicrobium sediminis]|uniref:Iron ABC transporter substrate-binding protein n=1 Tax=Anaeromicrobium sediminis TaxID=1478221 RepID=A0A267MMM1_9FIRM|nr:ABC transporter substrate-binding protein [Anaeromicrobium sediminis]PAB59990.1 iron ABC transporter substrate-binding protein [Anaeromicrobium sediminis]